MTGLLCSIDKETEAGKVVLVVEGGRWAALLQHTPPTPRFSNRSSVLGVRR